MTERGGGTAAAPEEPGAAGSGRRWDAVVVGGGPAGSAAALRLLAAGRRVAVVERDPFPRFHIGESLLPESGALFERLGVAGEVAAAGFVSKRGGVFAHESGATRGRVSFSRTLQPTAASTWQVDRARFDRLLLEAARARGADLFQPARAVAAELGRDGVQVEIVETSAERGDAERRLTLAASYLVDASGRGGFLAKRLGLRRPDPTLQNVALYGHYRGWKWPPDVEAGDIQVVSRRDLGWAWIIPLADGVTSAGVVVSRESWRRRSSREHGALLDELLHAMPVVAPQIGEASRLGEARVEADFSYDTASYAEDRWLLAGDAGSFLDPVFSTGVLLALQGGEEAGAAIDRALERPAAAVRHLARYRRLQRHRYAFFGRFVRAFYDPSARDLLCSPTPRLRLVEALNSVLAGHSRLRWRVRWRIAAFFALARLQRRLPLVPWLHQREPAASEEHRSEARRSPRGLGLGGDVRG